MYAYAVLLVPNESSVMRNDYRCDRDLAVGVDTYRCSQQDNVEGFNLESKRFVYYCETEDQAYHLAYTLAKKFVGTSWLVSKSVKFINVTPGPLNIATFTEKGLLP